MLRLARAALQRLLPPGREVAAYQAQTLLRNRWIARLDAHSVVDGKAQFLLAAEVPFCCLDRDVSEQKLDLVQLATARWQSLAQLRRRSCGASFSIPARFAAARTTPHSTLGVMPVPGGKSGRERGIL